MKKDRRGQKVGEGTLPGNRRHRGESACQRDPSPPDRGGIHLAHRRPSYLVNLPQAEKASFFLLSLSLGILSSSCCFQNNFQGRKDQRWRFSPGVWRSCQEGEDRKKFSGNKKELLQRFFQKKKREGEWRTEKREEKRRVNRESSRG